MSWVTRDGRVLSIKEMTTDHICNAMHCLARLPRDSFTASRLWLLQQELKRRPDVSRATLLYYT